MEWIRWNKNPWGQEIILGLSWDVAWIALALGILFAMGHALVALLRPAKFTAGGVWGSRPLNHNGFKVLLMENLVKRAVRDAKV